MTFPSLTPRHTSPFRIIPEAAHVLVTRAAARCGLETIQVRKVNFKLIDTVSDCQKHAVHPPWGE
jgi:hypothetical protein